MDGWDETSDDLKLAGDLVFLLVSWTTMLHMLFGCWGGFIFFTKGR
jgi:hypothetical protein